MAATTEGNKLRLTGVVGEYMFEDGFTADDVVMALAEFDDTAELNVHINSAGGIATEGAAIHSILSARAGVTNVIIEGIAASAASLIAMAGETITMTLGSVMMIHDPAAATIGNSADHAKTIEGLEALSTAYARVYAAKSGKTAAECREIMRAETWFEPDQAVAAGFADEVLDTRTPAVAAFDYRVFAHAPQHLVAMATSKNWRFPDASVPAASAAKSSQKQETSMSEKTVSATAHATATSRIKAIMQAPEAEGRDKLAEHLAFDTTMAVEDAIAIMKAAPQAAEQGSDLAAFEARRLAGRTDGRLNGEGLNISRPPQAESGLVAAMKQRHGVK